MQTSKIGQEGRIERPKGVGLIYQCSRCGGADPAGISRYRALRRRMRQNYTNSMTAFRKIT